MEIFNDKKYIKIETYITNTGTETITDLEYKRKVDWDVWPRLIGALSNYWGMDDIRPNLFKSLKCKAKCVSCLVVEIGSYPPLYW